MRRIPVTQSSDRPAVNKVVKPSFLVRFQPRHNCTETFPPILVFDLRNACLEIMHNAVDLP